MKAEYLDHMGSDLTVVNAARVSFKKKSEELKGKDVKLIRYLAEHSHWTPFGHAILQLHVKAPIFVARQLFKHQVGLVVNEVSRRYVDDEPEFFMPQAWRERPEASIKQGSGTGTLVTMDFTYLDGCTVEQDISCLVSSHNETAFRVYDAMIKRGVAPEQARMVLPQSMYTEWWWTGSLAAWARICSLRLDEHAQQETQDLAHQFSEIAEKYFPQSWEALTASKKVQKAVIAARLAGVTE